MIIENQKPLSNLYDVVYSLYKKNSTMLPVHSWPHINFVFKKSSEFAVELGADIIIVQASALIHDLNYFDDLNILNINEGDMLFSAGFDLQKITKIRTAVEEARTTKRSECISLEAMALSDGDTLFKALPITPVLFARDFMKENDMNIRELAGKIISFQGSLLDKGIYFYSKSASKYLEWAQTNIALWRNILESLNDQDGVELVKSQGLTDYDY